jgi:hypothetical protein
MADDIDVRIIQVKMKSMISISIITVINWDPPKWAPRLF